MREILFKAMSIEDDANFAHWVTGDLQTIYGEVSIANNNGVFKVYPETVCQYIGVEHPEHGKIFEGDVFRDEDGIFVVSFEDNLGSCGCCWDSFEGVGFAGKYMKAKYSFIHFTTNLFKENIEFVGNIHDDGFDIEEVEL